MIQINPTLLLLLIIIIIIKVSAARCEPCARVPPELARGARRRGRSPLGCGQTGSTLINGVPYKVMFFAGLEQIHALACLGNADGAQSPVRPLGDTSTPEQIT